ncbi:hypothetical protein Q8F55_001788 [Vanrija albida]|uniref:Uncharacterized protein n=1 Tax=Vanrija albida TaxID=181172 RepID=A0ABR3Q7Y6_9TREE
MLLTRTPTTASTATGTTISSTSTATTTSTAATVATTTTTATASPTPTPTTDIYLGALADVCRPLSWRVFHAVFVLDLPRGILPFLFTFNVLAHLANFFLLSALTLGADALERDLPAPLRFRPDARYAFFSCYAPYLPAPNTARDLVLVLRDAGACLRGLAFLAALLVRLPVALALAFAAPSRFGPIPRAPLPALEPADIDDFTAKVYARAARRKAAAAAARLAAKPLPPTPKFYAPYLPDRVVKALNKPPPKKRRSSASPVAHRAIAEHRRLRGYPPLMREATATSAKSSGTLHNIKAALNLKAKIRARYEEWCASGFVYEDCTGGHPARELFDNISHDALRAKHGLNSIVWSGAVHGDGTRHLPPIERARARIAEARQNIRDLKAEKADKVIVQFVQFQLEYQQRELRYELKRASNNHYFWRVGGLDKSKRPPFLTYLGRAIAIRVEVART